jgi:hypothetical protein
MKRPKLKGIIVHQHVYDRCIAEYGGFKQGNANSNKKSMIWEKLYHC